MNRTRQLLQSTILVILFFGLSKVTGLVRGQLVANRFGTGGEFDAFTAANQLPELFYVLIAGGALAAAFIPVFSSYLSDERLVEAMRLTHSTLTLVIAVLGGIAAISALLADPLAAVLTPDFDPDQQQLMADLMRIILIQTMLFGISGVLTGYLQANQHFALPALASVALDIGYVVGLFAFVPRLGIQGLAWGTVVGGALHIAIQVPALVRHRFTYRPAVDWRLAGVREIIRLMGPRIITLGAIQFADLFIIRLLSALPPGSTSAYFYGFTLMQLPETLFGTAIALVVFPTMANYFNRGDLGRMKALAVNALGIIWTLTVPSAVGMIIIGRVLIRLLFERGAFTAESTALVYGAILFFSFRIVAEGTLEIVARLFYAQHDTRTPMFAYLLWLAIQVGLAFGLVGPLGVGGLALASTIAFTALAALLFWLNWRRLGDLGGRRLWGSGGRALAASAGMALVLWGLQAAIPSEILFLLAGIPAGLLVYIGLSLLMGGKEIPDLVRLLRQRAVSPA